MKASGRLLGSVMLVAMTIGCSVERTLSARFDRAVETEASLVEHIVAPQTTDPAIDKFLEDHYAWLDTTAQSNHKLLVFLPGSRQRPALFQLVQQEAARLGYHVIGLQFVNFHNGFVLTCSSPGQSNPSECFEAGRLESIENESEVSGSGPGRVELELAP